MLIFIIEFFIFDKMVIIFKWPLLAVMIVPVVDFLAGAWGPSSKQISVIFIGEASFYPYILDRCLQ